MKKLSPPSTERFRPDMIPPVTLVSISTPPDMLVMPPASALTSLPGAIRISASANAGLNVMSTSMRDLLLDDGADESLAARAHAISRRNAGRGIWPSASTRSWKSRSTNEAPSRVAARARACSISIMPIM